MVAFFYEKRDCNAKHMEGGMAKYDAAAFVLYVFAAMDGSVLVIIFTREKHTAVVGIYEHGRNNRKLDFIYFAVAYAHCRLVLYF